MSAGTYRKAARALRAGASSLLAVTVIAAVFVALPQAARPAGAVATPVTLSTPEIVRSNGADLQWSRYVEAADAPFDAYEVHRSTTSTFTATTSTRLTSIEDIDTLRYTDTTAAPSKTFYYKVKVAGAVSGPLTVVTEAAGVARATLQPGSSTGRATFLRNATAAGSTCATGTQWGAAQDVRIGTSRSGSYHRGLLWFDARRIPPAATVTGATLTLNFDAFANNPGTGTGVHLHSMNRAWTEGNGGGGCGTGKGATWKEAAPGTAWTAAGGDLGSTLATTAAKDRRVAGTDVFAGTTLNNYVQSWVSGTAPNFGLLLKLTTETLPDPACVQPCEKYFDYDADDSTTPTRRPKLVITYTDDSVSIAPTVVDISENTAPQAGPYDTTPPARDTATIRVAASDDRRVESVKFIGPSTITDTTPPFEATYAIPAGMGDVVQALDIEAKDDAGNITYLQRALRMWNPSDAAVSLTGPGDGSTVTGTVNVTASATPGAGGDLDRVEFYVDDVLIGEDATAPYEAPWLTADQVKNVYDGTHVLKARAVDRSGKTNVSSTRSVTVANSANTSRKAAFDLGATGPADDEGLIESVSREGSGAKAGSGKSMNAAPDNNSGGGSCATDRTCFDIKVSNTSGQNWPGGVMRVWYRWYTPEGLVVFEGPVGNDLPAINAGQTKTEHAEIEVPGLPDGTEAADYRLRLDVYDDNGVWFAGAGNPPVDRRVRVSKNANDRLGIEHWWSYDTESVGGGMEHLVNVANGNSLLGWTPFEAPGRGVSTVARLTYNSLEDRSDSPAGNNFSLTVSGLARLGSRLDVHPNKADEISGRSASCWVAFIDGDGTRQRFDGASSCTQWTAPKGEHLYLRREAGTDPNRGWLLTKPDHTTFKFDSEGYPVSVTDRNANVLAFSLSDVAPGDDPGGNKKRVTRVTDAGGRFFDIEYVSRDEARNAHVRGKVKRLVDHSGSATEFEYYDDGNLLRLRQPRSGDVIGENPGDRTYTFTYTTPSGSGPALPISSDRLNPDPRTPSQSARLYSVRDPQGVETLFAYYGQSDPPALRWRIKSRTDRAGHATTYAYDAVARTATVTRPLSRTTTWTTDDRGRPVDQVDAIGRHVYRSWSDDNMLVSLSDPTTALPAAADKQLFEHNANGMLTKAVNQANEAQTLDYRNLPADAADPAHTSAT